MHAEADPIDAGGAAAGLDAESPSRPLGKREQKAAQKAAKHQQRWVLLSLLLLLRPPLSFRMERTCGEGCVCVCVCMCLGEGTMLTVAPMATRRQLRARIKSEQAARLAAEAEVASAEQHC